MTYLSETSVDNRFPEMANDWLPRDSHSRGKSTIPSGLKDPLAGRGFGAI
jgi:hypothetical protein|tara:strand:+ start:8451 stop:8600 length:150 start_codon:yes stop_codon:yes gene_type:complete